MRRLKNAKGEEIGVSTNDGTPREPSKRGELITTGMLDVDRKLKRKVPDEKK